MNSTRSARLTDAGILLAGAGGAALLAVALVKRPGQAELALGLLAVAAVAVVAFRRRRLLSRLGSAQVLTWIALLLPLAALVGPALAPPGLRQFFAFRLLLAAAGVIAVVLLVAAPSTPRWRVPRYLALFGVWFAWLAAGMIWAADKSAGFRYLVVFATMLALTAATAYAGTSGRRLRALVITLAIAYVLTIGVALLEVVTGHHLASSSLVNATGSHQLGVSAFYYNPNNLATFLTMAWAFLLTVFLFTRRRRWQLVTLGALALGLFVFLRTGSRSSLLVIGLETLVLAPLLLRMGSPRVARVVAAVAIIVIAGLGLLAFNTSDNPVLKQFNVTALVTNVEQGYGSGATRLDLTRTGMTLAGRSYLLGVGPGNAESHVKQATGDPNETGNLHDWWLEVLVDGGLPALVLYAIIYFGLAGAMYRVARRTRDTLTRYLAISTLVALVGYVVGSLGPSSAIGFAPMWILFGVALAVIVRAESLARAEAPA